MSAHTALTEGLKAQNMQREIIKFHRAIDIYFGHKIARAAHRVRHSQRRQHERPQFTVADREGIGQHHEVRIPETGPLEYYRRTAKHHTMWLDEAHRMIQKAREADATRRPILLTQARRCLIISNDTKKKAPLP